MDQDLLARYEATFVDVVDTLIANGVEVQRDGREYMQLPKFDGGWFLVENDRGIRSDLIEDGVARFTAIVDALYTNGLKNKQRFDGREYLPLFGRWFPVDDKPKLAEALLADLRARTTLLVNGLSCTSP
jgi:hypothetical protein